MQIDLNSLSRKELEALRADVEKALSTLENRERSAALNAAKQAAEAHGFTLDQLTGVSLSKGSSKGKSKNPAKYRNPENPMQTWTGRGRKPQWIKDAEEAGVDISTLEI